MQAKSVLIIALTTCAAVLLGGCADLTSIGRTTLTAQNKAIHLDAKQRVIMTRDVPVPANTEGVTNIYCAEPSPDALSAFTSSFGGGLATPNSFSASIAATLSESAGSIGLRTQTITLLRDYMYRVCESAYNKHIGPRMVAQLHERFQDVTVALLAIEQLTGVVKARQVLLTGQANAAASAAVLDAENSLKEAQRRETVAAKALQDAKTAKTDAETLASQKLAAFNGAPCNGTVPTAPAPDTDDCKTQKADSDQAEQDAETARSEVIEAEATLKRRKELREQLEQAYDVAMADAQAQASTSGQFEPAANTSHISDKSAQHISKAVTEIVDAVVNKDHIVDSCIVLITENVVVQQKAAQAAADRRAFSPPFQTMGFTSEEKHTSTVSFCETIIAEALKNS